jgi:hypothetical protein
MTLETAIALLSALVSAGELINKIVSERKAAGHPLNAPLSAEHEAAIRKAVAWNADSMVNIWDETHAGEGG